MASEDGEAAGQDRAQPLELSASDVSHTVDSGEGQPQPRSSSAERASEIAKTAERNQSAPSKLEPDEQVVAPAGVERSQDPARIRVQLTEIEEVLGSKTAEIEIPQPGPSKLEEDGQLVAPSLVDRSQEPPHIRVPLTEIEEVLDAVTKPDRGAELGPRTRTLDEPPAVEPPLEELGDPPPMEQEQIDWLAFLEGQYRASTTVSGSRIDKMMIDAIKRKGAEKRQLSLIDPLLRRLSFKVVLLVLACLCLALAVQVSLFTAHAPTQSSQFSIEILQLRRADAPLSLTNIGAIGAIVDGCEVHGTTSQVSDSTMRVSFPRKLAADGWFLDTAGDDPAWDPVRFAVVAEDSMVPVLAVRLNVDLSGTARGLRTWALDPPAAARGRVRVSAQPVPIITGLRSLSYVLLLLGCVLVVLLASRQHLARARAALVLTLALLALLSCSVAIALSSTRHGLLSLQWWRDSLVSSVLTLCVASSEIRLSLIAALCAALLSQAILVSVEFALLSSLERAGSSASAMRGWVAGFFLSLEFAEMLCELALAVVLGVSRSRIIARAQHSVQSIKDMLAKAWREELDKVGPDRQQVLHDIADMTSLLSQGLHKRPHQRLTDKSLRHGRHLNSASPTVRSLDQLYSQAWGCGLLLRLKVKQLALSCGGMFARVSEHRRPADRSSLFVCWDVAQFSKELQEEIEWTPLKPESRAVDKVLNHYLGDVSRITDLCRETLVVGSLSDVADCLQAVMWDRQIQVERVKNYLTGQYGEEADSHDSGGFKALVLNLRIVNAESKALGLDGHICELLILPHAVACCLTLADPRLLQQLREAKAIGALSGGIRHSLTAKWKSACQTLRNIVSCLTSGSIAQHQSQGLHFSDSATHLPRLHAKGSRHGSFRAGSRRPSEREPSAHLTARSGTSAGHGSGGNGTRSSPQRSTGGPGGWSDDGGSTARRLSRMRRHSWASGAGVGPVSESGFDTLSHALSSSVDSSNQGNRTHRSAGEGSPLSPVSGGPVVAQARRLSDAMLGQLTMGLNWSQNQSRSQSQSQSQSQSAAGAAAGTAAGITASVSASASSEQQKLQRRRFSETAIHSARCSLELTPVEEGLEPRVWPPSTPAIRPTTQPNSYNSSFRAIRAEMRAHGSSMRSMGTIISTAGSSEFSRSRSNSNASEAQADMASVQNSSRGMRRSKRRRRSKNGAGDPRSSSRALSDMVRRGTSAFSRFGSLVKVTAWRAQQSVPGDVSSEYGDGQGLGYPGRGQGAWYDLMERLYWERTQGKVDRLDEKKGHISSAVSNAEHLAALKTSFPIPSAMCKTWFLLAAALLAAMFMASGAAGMARVGNEGGRAAARWVRFSVLAVRDGEEGVAPAVGGLGLLQNGCLQNMSALATVISHEAREPGALGDQWEVDLGEPQAVQGFFWRTSALDPDRDPAVFEVEVSGDGLAWELLAASQHSVHVGGAQHWDADEDEPYSAPVQRNAIVLLDARTPWYLWLAGPVPEFMQGVGWMVLCACGYAHKRRWLDKWLRRGVSGVEAWLVFGNNAVVLGFAAAAVCLVVSAAAQQEGIGGNAVHLGLNWAWACVGVGAAFVVHRAARLLIEGLTLIGLARIALRVCDSLLHPSELSITENGVELDVVSWLLLVGGLSLILKKVNAKRVATRDVQGDVLRYEQAWATLTETKHAGLQMIRYEADIIQERLLHWYPVHQAYIAEVKTPFLGRKKARSRFFGEGGGSERRASATWRSLIGAAHTHRNSSPAIAKRGSLASLLGRGSLSMRGSDSRRASTCSEDIHRPGLGSLVDRPHPDVDSQGALEELHTRPSSTRTAGKEDEEAGGAGLELETCSSAPGRDLTRKLESPTEVEGSFSSWPLAEGKPTISSALAHLARLGGIRRAASDFPPATEHMHAHGELSPPLRGLGKRDSVMSRGSEGSQVQLMKRKRDSVASSLSLNSPHPPPSTSESRFASPQELTGIASPVRTRNSRGRGSDPGLYDSSSFSPNSPAGLRARRHSVNESFRGMKSLLFQKAANLFVHPAAAQSGSGVRRKHSRRSWSSSSQRGSRSGSIRNSFFHKRRGSEIGGDWLPVDSLEQLFAQAAGLYPILKAKVQHWAGHPDCRGMFPVNASEDRGRFDFWGDMVEQYGEEGADARVKWPSLKGTERAIEKLVRVYEGRAYRLLDICRQSIVFEEPEQLAQCLKQIREDADVDVVAIKNRLTDDYDARALSLGYRDVNINLRIYNERTKKHGINPHICEVQLLLKSFSEYKSVAGHKRYVAFRNARGR